LNLWKKVKFIIIGIITGIIIAIQELPITIKNAILTIKIIDNDWRSISNKRWKKTARRNYSTRSKK
jgi:hypothetical protein